MQPRFATALILSVVLHGLLLGSLVFGFAWRPVSKAATAPVLAIQAAVVDESMIEAELAKLEAADQRIREAEVQRLRELDEQTARAKAEREKEEQRLAALERERKAAEVRDRELAQQRDKTERERQANAAQAAKEAAERQARAEAEKKRLAELEQTRLKEEQRLAALAEQRRKEEAERKKAAAAAAQAEREEQLRLAVAEETARIDAVEGGLLDEYRTLISQKIERNWNRPPGAQSGLKCELLLTQIPGGDVKDVQIISCNGDAVVLRSIEAAVFNASPLPPPPDPRLFERRVRVFFEPEN